MELINNIPSIVKDKISYDWCTAYQIVDNKVQLNTIHITSRKNMSLSEMQDFHNKLLKLGYHYNSRHLLKMPKAGTPYYYINLNKRAEISHAVWSYSTADIQRFDVGNCFLTEESTYDIAAALKQLLYENSKKFRL